MSKCIWHGYSGGWLPGCEGDMQRDFPNSGYCPFCGEEIDIDDDPTPWEAPVGPGPASDPMPYDPGRNR